MEYYLNLDDEALIVNFGLQSRSLVDQIYELNGQLNSLKNGVNQLNNRIEIGVNCNLCDSDHRQNIVTSEIATECNIVVVPDILPQDEKDLSDDSIVKQKTLEISRLRNNLYNMRKRLSEKSEELKILQ